MPSVPVKVASPPFSELEQIVLQQTGRIQRYSLPDHNADAAGVGDVLQGIFLFLGISVYLLGVVLSVVRAYSALAVERLVAVATLAVLIALAASLAGVWLLIAVDVVLLAILAVEHYRVEVAHRMVRVSRKSSTTNSANADDSPK